MQRLTLLILAVLSASSHAQSFPTAVKTTGGNAVMTERPAAPPSQARTPSAPTCTFADKKLPADTIVIAAGDYEGRRIDFQIDEEGQASQFDVKVHADKPVALLLGAYSPTIWNILRTQDTRVVAVFASGYHRQVVAGLPKGTPVITSYFRQNNGDSSTCGSQYITADSELTWLNPKSRVVFGKPVTRVYTKHTMGLIDIVESSEPKTVYRSSPDTPPESFRDTSAPLSGDAGLADAVAKGLLRPATESDKLLVRDAYRQSTAAAQAREAGRDVPPAAGAQKQPRDVLISLRRAYVVLKPQTYPAGLTGLQSAVFIVPKGVAVPKGNPGHGTVFDLNTLQTCSVGTCRPMDSRK